MRVLILGASGFLGRSVVDLSRRIGLSLHDPRSMLNERLDLRFPSSWERLEAIAVSLSIDIVIDLVAPFVDPHSRTGAEVPEEWLMYPRRLVDLARQLSARVVSVGSEGADERRDQYAIFKSNYREIVDYDTNVESLVLEVPRLVGVGLHRGSLVSQLIEAAVRVRPFALLDPLKVRNHLSVQVAAQLVVAGALGAELEGQVSVLRASNRDIAELVQAEVARLRDFGSDLLAAAALNVLTDHDQWALWSSSLREPGSGYGVPVVPCPVIDELAAMCASSIYSIRSRPRD